MRLYRGLLWLYPAEFREEYGRELCLVLQCQCREQRSFPRLLVVWLHAIWGVLTEAPQEHFHVIMQDLRYAVRILRKDALVTVSAVAILSLGVGATTLVFSLANGLLIRPLPYVDQERLVQVQECSPQDPRFGRNVAFPNYQDMRARSRLLEDLGVYTDGSTAVRGEGEAEQVQSARMSDGVFGILGIAPILGRTFTRTEDTPGGPKVVVLSQELWQSRYGGDPKILGKTLQLGNSSYSVVGIMPAGFHFPRLAELWTPLQLNSKLSPRTDYFLESVARLKPGVTVQQATQEARSMLAQINRENPVADGGNTARAVPLRDSVAREYREAVITLLVAVGLLLLIACANVSNLLLVKASARIREMAIRTAIGASRRRLIRQLIAESSLLGATGGLVGLALAYLGIPALLALIQIELPRWMDFSVDQRVLAFAFGVSILTSLVFGIVPAFTVSGVDVTNALKEAGRPGTTASRQQFLRNGLVITEIALSMMLLAGAGLMIRSFLAMRTQHLGYQPENLLTMQISPPGAHYASGATAHALLRRLSAEIGSLPGVSSLAFASGVPLLTTWGRSLTVEGYPVLGLKDAPSIYHTVSTPEYFRTLQIPLLEGRDFTEADFANPFVTIVAESLARKYWPRGSAIGKRVRYGPPENNEPWRTIVGVVADAKNEEIKRQGRMNVYLPYNKDYTPNSLLIRTSIDPLRLARSVKARIAGVDRGIAVSRILSLDQVVSRAAWQDRFFTVLLAVFAGLATALAAVGLYAVLAYTVSMRRHEIGIRMALGAPAGRVRAMIMRQGLTLAGAGLVLGIAVAAALMRVLETQLYQTSPVDPGTYSSVVVLMFIVVLAATYLPARRAIRVDPVIALRQE